MRNFFDTFIFKSEFFIDSNIITMNVSFFIAVLLSFILFIREIKLIQKFLTKLGINKDFLDPSEIRTTNLFSFSNALDICHNSLFILMIIAIFFHLSFFVLSSFSFDLDSNPTMLLGVITSYVCITLSITIFWHVVAWRLRHALTNTLIEAVDFIYMILAFTSIVIGFTEHLNERSFITNSLVALLAANAIALRITKTSAKIYHWHI